MKKIYLLAVLSILLQSVCQSQSFSWAKREGLYEYDYGYGVSTDNSGNVYVAGKYEQNANFSGTIVPCAGNHDIYLAKYTSSGSLIWVKTAGGDNGDYAQAMVCDGSNYVYVAGEIEGYGTVNFVGSSITLHGKGDNDIFLAKYDLDGNLLWAKSAGGSGNDRAVGVSYDAAGNIYITGQYEGSATFGSSTTITANGDKDMFVAKYDADGNFKWVQKGGGPQKDEGLSVKSDPSGNVYVCGKYKNGAIFGSTTLSCTNFYYSAFIAKYDVDGNLKWIKTGKSDFDDLAWGITMDNSGKIFVAGEFNAYSVFGPLSLTTTGRNDIFVACYDSNGNILWLKKAGGSLIDRARGISCDGSNIYITGQFGSDAYFGSTTLHAADSSDVFVASLTNDGTFRWAIAAGGSADAYEDLGYESGDAVWADATGNVYATGAILNGGTFGNTSLNAYSRTDMFLTRIAQPTISAVPSSSFSILADSLCAGQTINLKDLSTNSPTSWLWSLPGGTPNSSTLQDPLVTYTNPGNYSITLTSANSIGNGNPITKNITINPIPDVTSSSISICEGQTATLTASGADSYVWNTGESTASIAIDTNLSATFSVTGITNGCSKTISDTVTINPNPEVPIIIVDQNSLTSSSPNGNQWYLNDNLIVGATAQNYTATIPGLYKVIVTNSFGCSATSNDVNIIISGIEAVKTSSNFKLYPNPTSGTFMIEVSTTNPLSIEILNELGQVIKNETFSNCAVKCTKTIDLSSFSKGVYLLKATTGNEIHERKIVLN